jgi:hypothetical protein
MSLTLSFKKPASFSSALETSSFLIAQFPVSMGSQQTRDFRLKCLSDQAGEKAGAKDNRVR